jgi:hypothetical protein
LLIGAFSTLASTALGFSLQRLMRLVRGEKPAAPERWVEIVILLLGAVFELAFFVALIVGTHAFSTDAPDLHGVSWLWVRDLSQRDPYGALAILVLVLSTFSLRWWARRTSPRARSVAFQILIAVASALAAAFSAAASGIGLVGRSIGGPLVLVVAARIRDDAG